jgi:hypothetical protein
MESIEQTALAGLRGREKLKRPLPTLREAPLAQNLGKTFWGRLFGLKGELKSGRQNRKFPLSPGTGRSRAIKGERT